LATAVFVLGPVKGYALCQRLDGVDGFLVDKDANVIFSPQLKARLSLLP
jgi:thiamine biosynthesis lipoprotein ApbE